MIGKMAHPLNRAELQRATLPRGRRVRSSAAAHHAVAADRPRRIAFSAHLLEPGGIDPYASAVSDVYQDLFDEGSYTGKGIYDVDAFEAALAGRVPENTLLSHDLFEGIFARAGLVSDIELVEEFPSRYDVAAARQHRWARGDWQLLPWIFGRAHGSDPDTAQPRDGRSSIPPIGRWKMLDNLRRSLSAPARLLALMAGWMLPLRAAVIWTAFIFATIAIPSLLPFLTGSFRGAATSPSAAISARSPPTLIGSSQPGLTLTLLAYQAWLMGDAISRTLFRLYLAVIACSRVDDGGSGEAADQRLDVRGFYGDDGGRLRSRLAAAIWLVAWAWRPAGRRAPFLVLWLAAPAVAR